MIITINKQTVEIIPELLSIFHQPINVFAAGSFDTNRFSEVKKIRFNLKVFIKERQWIIPYLVVLKKDLKEQLIDEYKDRFIELSSLVEDDSIDPIYKPSAKDIFVFSKYRFINQPYFEIFKNQFDETVFNLLNFIDSFDNEIISKDEYELIDKSTFFNFSPLEIEQLITNQKFVIREYRLQDFEFNSKERLDKDFNSNLWQIPNFNYAERVLLSAKIFGNSLLLVIPKNYFSKYRPSFEKINFTLSPNNTLNRQIFKDFQGANIFNGSYEECLSLLHDEKKLSELRKEFLKRREKSRLGQISFRDDSDWGGLYGDEAELGRWNTD